MSKKRNHKQSFGRKGDRMAMERCRGDATYKFAVAVFRFHAAFLRY
jgi:hypothetical protein